MTVGTGKVAQGADGGSLARRIYRRSPIRYAHKIVWNHRGVTRNDVMIAAYPRSGGVWLRFLLVELAFGNATFPTVRRDAGYVGRPLDVSSTLPDGARLIKTHEPYMARYGRAVHLVRDPRDVVLSYFKFFQRIGKLHIEPGDDPAATFDYFVDSFLTGKVDAFGTWQSHLLSWARASEAGKADVLRIRYEDLRADTPGLLMEMAEWLKHPLTTAEAATVAERCSLERMREAELTAASIDPAIFQGRDSSQPLVNEGKVEGWRAALTEAQLKRFSSMAEGLALMGYQPA